MNMVLIAFCQGDSLVLDVL